MLSVAKLVRYLSRRTEWPISDLEERAKILRANGLLPRRSGELYGPSIGARDAARFLLSLGAPRVRHCDDDTQLLEQLPLVSGVHPALEVKTLGEALEAILADTAGAIPVLELELSRLARRAVLRLEPVESGASEIALVFAVSDSIALGLDLDLAVRVGAGVLHELAVELSEDVAEEDDSAWTPDIDA